MVSIFVFDMLISPNQKIEPLTSGVDTLETCDETIGIDLVGRGNGPRDKKPEEAANTTTDIDN